VGHLHAAMAKHEDVDGGTVWKLKKSFGLSSEKQLLKTWTTKYTKEISLIWSSFVSFCG